MICKNTITHASIAVLAVKDAEETASAMDVSGALHNG
jgi:hypothetical protein